MRDHPRLLLFTGAGLSVGSGLPAFRMGADAIWNGWSMAEVSDYRTWQANYQKVHAFYNERRAALSTVQPNAAHRAIATWQRTWPTTLFTTNIDDLLERAGCTDVIHVHGIATEMRCTSCGVVWEIGYASFDPEIPCPACGANRAVKPNVIFDDEDAPLYPALEDAFRVGNMHSGDVTVVIGSSGYSIAMELLCWCRPGHKVLNILEPSSWIDERLFDRCIYTSAVTALAEVEHDIRHHLGDGG